MRSTIIRLWRAMGGLLAGGAVDILLLRWLIPTPEAWAKLLAEQAYADSHGQFMCIYDPLPFIHSRGFYAFLTAPATLYVAMTTIGLVVAGHLASTLTARRESRAAGGDALAAGANPGGAREDRAMAKPSLVLCVVVALAALHAAPLLAVMVAVLLAWLIAMLSDGTPAVAILLTAMLLLTFAMQMALLLAPVF